MFAKLKYDKKHYQSKPMKSIRLPVGLSYMPDDNLPMDIFVEIGPAIDIAPDVQGEITGGVGVRYWF